jgi:ElaB/YqjD/DUF883 family membrane-anchored ribosome-binding protein
VTTNRTIIAGARHYNLTPRVLDPTPQFLSNKQIKGAKMQNDTSKNDTSKNDTSKNPGEKAQATGEHMVHKVGAAAHRVGDAARSAGGQVGAVAREEVENLRADLDDLISRIPHLSDIDLEEAKERLMGKIASTREAAHDLAYDAREQFDYGVERTKECVREHPLESIGYAAAAGLIIGLLMSRR